MHIGDILTNNKITFSFEFFPPRDPTSSDELFRSIRELVPLKPGYVSVTYGAGGSTRELTHDLVLKIQKETELTVVSHLTCVGSTRDEILEVLTRYKSEGICNIMALRGDPPHGQERFVMTEGGFQFATELVAFIKQHFPGMGIGVAGYPEGHPETPNRLREMEHLKMKVDAGADYICTQLFFDNRDFYDFRDRCRVAGITVPILAGIMPVTSRKGILRMADLALGARFPARLMKDLARAESDEYVEKVGIHWATTQVDDLIDNGAQGVHFYTLNRSRATREIYASLGASSSEVFNR
ncbi:MAG TPA: methylenetetrahydrofolate reductase [NAD(P)H] [Spirochaetota bacterium]|nr:methylenetetrahydrofolate reductase [NAD(P)H] [Spirochaetota bacterium]HNT12468.1 methylenetetrahydrofolate reductase [NAD(P)H] [Spirochaetota bacterium]HNV45840.1 methylenetetrahydrofolate reductase [NAD(P)H] [Spirochaetota bacterium]HOS38474.1 methylenetetrahydrofolate reductase [NAD(P)H] [Spirochaetota bacterium]HPU87406.1 methylenetetrahydrofolate reductase [NAD(P)H] [Spirochaetota bacterium]